jgi:hypothetical protein
MTASGNPQALAGKQPVTRFQQMGNDRKTSHRNQPTKSDSTVDSSKRFHSGNPLSIGKAGVHLAHQLFPGAIKGRGLEIVCGNVGQHELVTPIDFSNPGNFPPTKWTGAIIKQLQHTGRVRLRSIDEFLLRFVFRFALGRFGFHEVDQPLFATWANVPSDAIRPRISWQKKIIISFANNGRFLPESR